MKQTIAVKAVAQPMPSPGRMLPYRVLSIVLGLLLVVSAVLKIWEYLQAPPLERTQTLSLVEAEMFLAVWLMSGLSRRVAWGVALAAFVGLASISLYKALGGETSCGCFGVIKVNPWVTFGLDVVAVLCLLLVRKSAFTAKIGQASLGRPVGISMAALSIAAVVGIYMISRPAIGLAEDGLVAVRNESHSHPVLPATIPDQATTTATLLPPSQLVDSLGYVVPKSSHPLSFVVTNPSNRPLRITKVEVECGCIHFPTSVETIPAGSFQTISAQFVAPDIHEFYTKRVVLFTDHSDFAPFVLQVAARVGLPLRSVPEELTVPPTAGERGTEIPFTIVNDGDKPARVLYAISSDGRLTIGAPRDGAPAGGKLSLNAVVSSSGKPGAPKEFTVRIQTDLIDQPVIEIPGHF